MGRNEEFQGGRQFTRRPGEAFLMSRRQAFEEGRRHGDYELLYNTPEMGSGSHRITALLGGERVGEMSWGSKEIHGLDVNDAHQRRGLATAMWNYGQEMRPRPKHSADRTDKGEAWARKVGGRLPRRKAVPT